MPVPCLPGISHLGALRRDWLGLLARVAATLGDVGAFRVGPRVGVVVNAPALAARVLIHHAEHVEKGPLLTRLARTFMGEGLVTCPQAAHGAARAHIQPAFTPRRVAGHLPGLWAVAEAAVDTLVPGEVVDVHGWLTHVAIGLIGRALFAHEGAVDPTELEAAARAGLHYINHRIRHPLGAPLWWPTDLNRQARWARTALHTLVDTQVARRRAAPTAGDDVLSHLLEAPLSPQALRDHVVTLLLAGFETVAAHLAWTLALLAEHPGAEARFLSEIDGLPARPTEADLDGLAFTRRILEESLRLYPPAHTLGRVLRAPLELGGHTLQAGAVVIVSPWLLHRRADLFPDPERFDPDRAPAPRHALVPFGLGPRSCIGARFATLEALVVLVALARRVRLVPETLGRPAAETLLTLRPVGFRARVVPRSGDGFNPGAASGTLRR